MMRIEDNVLKEIHKIREENYYATKNMSSKEYVEKVNKTAEEAAKKYGFKILKGTYSSR